MKEEEEPELTPQLKEKKRSWVQDQKVLDENEVPVNKGGDQNEKAACLKQLRVKEYSALSIETEGLSFLPLIPILTRVAWCESGRR